MTGPTNTKNAPSTASGKSAATDDGAGTDEAARDQEAGRPAEEDRPTPTDGQLDELARTQDETAHRVRELVAGQVIDAASEGESDDERLQRLLTAARADLLSELRSQEQERARQELADATRSSEDAVAGLVRGVTTIVRSVVPAVVVRPEEVIEATYALADQGLRVSRRLALTVTGGVRSLSPSA